MVEKYNGDNPVNARIKIDYSKKKPTVKFSYPDLKNQFKGSMFIYIFLVWALILLICCYSYNFAEKINDFNTPETNFSNMTQCVDYYVEQDTDYCNERVGKSSFGILWSVLKENKRIYFWFMFLILPPMITYLPFRKKWNKLYPATNALLARKKYRTFTNRDIEKDNKGNYYCEIPLFNNILCNYNATKDFSKHLKYFEIIEHKFYYKRKPTKKNKSKRKINEHLWYARFYFKQKPELGKLDVVFK